MKISLTIAHGSIDSSDNDFFDFEEINRRKKLVSYKPCSIDDDIVMGIDDDMKNLTIEHISPDDLSLKCIPKSSDRIIITFVEYGSVLQSTQELCNFIIKYIYDSDKIKLFRDFVKECIKKDKKDPSYSFGEKYKDIIEDIRKYIGVEEKFDIYIYHEKYINQYLKYPNEYYYCDETKQLGGKNIHSIINYKDVVDDIFKNVNINIIINKQDLKNFLKDFYTDLFNKYQYQYQFVNIVNKDSLLDKIVLKFDNTNLFTATINYLQLKEISNFFFQELTKETILIDNSIISSSHPNYNNVKIKFGTYLIEYKQNQIETKNIITNANTIYVSGDKITDIYNLISNDIITKDSKLDIFITCRNKRKFEQDDMDDILKIDRYAIRLSDFFIRQNDIDLLTIDKTSSNRTYLYFNEIGFNRIIDEMIINTPILISNFKNPSEYRSALFNRRRRRELRNDINNSWKKCFSIDKPKPLPSISTYDIHISAVNVDVKQSKLLSSLTYYICSNQKLETYDAFSYSFYKNIYLIKIYNVCASEQRKGHTKKLLDNVIEKLKEKYGDNTYIWLYVLYSNEIAYKIYLKQGFIPCFNNDNTLLSMYYTGKTNDDAIVNRCIELKKDYVNTANKLQGIRNDCFFIYYEDIIHKFGTSKIIDLCKILVDRDFCIHYNNNNVKISLNPFWLSSKNYKQLESSLGNTRVLIFDNLNSVNLSIDNFKILISSYFTLNNLTSEGITEEVISSKEISSKGISSKGISSDILYFVNLFNYYENI